MDPPAETVPEAWSWFHLTLLWGQLWHLIDMLTTVPRVGHTESKIKIKCFEQLVPEVVSLHHPELTYLPVSHREIHTVPRDKEAIRTGKCL